MTPEWVEINELITDKEIKRRAREIVSCIAHGGNVEHLMTVVDEVSANRTVAAATLIDLAMTVTAHNRIAAVMLGCSIDALLESFAIEEEQG